jgi:DNA sulfur modification protein DndB
MFVEVKTFDFQILIGESAHVAKSAGFTYQFAAIKGRQAGKDYFAAMVPLRLVPKLFLFDEQELEPRLRAQRKLNKTRIPEIARYVLENPREYVFSALTASIDGSIEFVPAKLAGVDGAIGQVNVPMSARFVINDGQHRRAAIEEVLRRRPELGSETICVVLFVDSGLKRSQQMFADLNKHAVRPTRSIGILYDHRDPLAQLARELVESVPVFRDLTEVDKATISNRSVELFTLSSIYFATRQLLKKGPRSAISREEAKFAREFWIHVSANMLDWQRAAEKRVASSVLRRQYIHAHGVALQAIAMAGADLVAQDPKGWSRRLAALRAIDWARSNRSLWEGRATIGGRLSKATNNVTLTANVIREQLGLALCPTDVTLERIHEIGKQQPITQKRRRSSHRAVDHRRQPAQNA